ncbi:hypothetical protein F0U61_45285 [Archangium violaceum]|uniref:hypothetical protein n=1 Tax=Archangium violaceum TaxID=83451 RepID=UPI002B2D77EF|nr:hypothetical protein F0U61_45285 [Archangium violaceum]
MSDLFNNAIESIINGVEDFSGKNPRRVSSAVRNLYAGILLLLKEKLYQESPPNSDGILIYQRFLPRPTPAGVVLVPGSNTTVDFRDIQQRFKALDLKIDWKRLERMQEIRNDVEHHKLKHPESVVREALANTFVLVATVLNDHLGEDPAQILGTTWQTMLAEATLFKTLDEECKKSRTNLKDMPSTAIPAVEEFLLCSSCDSSLMYTEDETYWHADFTCRACGAQSDLAQVIPTALARAYPPPRFWRPGDDPPDEIIGTCPNCREEAFSTEDDFCLVCGESRPYEECLRCGEHLSLDEQDSGLCSYCEHMSNRDD